MGAANSCTCGETPYRFKDFIVSVYPDNRHSDADEDALGKLQSYVASNPERIPRVCRKVGKIMRVHVANKEEDRVMVSVHMLRSLIEHSDRVDDYVPHSMDLCALLLATNVSRYHVGAAHILSTLCHRLSVLPNTDTARRLIADNKDRLVLQLIKMTSDHIASRKDTRAAQTRYAAILALGNIANCIHTALAGSAPTIMQAMIVNLILVLRERAQKPLSDASVRLLAKRHYGGPEAPSATSPSVQLPADAEQQDVVYALACSHGIGAIAACTTTAGVEGLLSCVTGLLDKQSGWSVPYVPSLVFSDIVSAMQRRPQQLGFSVYQCLCDVGQRTSDPAVRIGVLRSLQACVDELPMTGGRPAVVLDHIVRVMQLPVASTTAAGATAASAKAGEGVAESARQTGDTHDAVVVLTARLLRATYRQRNAPQLQSILVTLWKLVETAQSSGAPHPTLALRLLIVAAPYLRTVPLVDRKDMHVTQGIDFYLNGGGDDAQRHLASRVLTNVLAGIPEQLQSAAVATVTTAQTMMASPSTASSRAGALFTDEEDVAYAQEWVKRVSSSTEGITPLTVVSVANVLCAIMAGYGVSGLPFSLTFMWTLQQRCVRADPSSAPLSPSASASVVPSAIAPPGALDDAASVATSNAAVSMTLLASKTPTSPLTRAWLHMIAAMLVCAGRVYGIPKLQAYGQEVLEKRAATAQLAKCFEPAVRAAEQPVDVYTVSGLRYLASDKSRPLGTDFTEAPVSRLPSFSYVSNVIVDAERPDIAVVFGASEEEELHTVIEEVCFQPESEVNVSLASALAARDTSITGSEASAAAAAARARRFSLRVHDEVKVLTLRSLRITIADGATQSAQDGGGAIPLSTAAATTAQKVREIAEHFNVSAATQVLPPETTSALPPLPLLPPPREDDETTGGMSETSDRGRAQSPPLYPVSCATADGRSRSLGTGESGAWVNPLDVDAGIQAGRKAQSAATLSLRSLPAARYVVMT